MPAVDLNQPAQLGLIRDVPAYKLPPHSWSTAMNVRYTDGAIARLGGHAQVFGTPNIAPSFHMPIQDASQVWWLYASLTKASVYDGSTHTDITRAVGGDYSAAAARAWNGTILGGIPILNSGSDDPQYWAAYSTGQALQDLSNWPAATTCKSMRAFGSQLIALNITESGTNFPHRVKFSHRAVPGALPSSWDDTDATVDTGEQDLSTVNTGLIIDGLPLRGSFYIYKDESTTVMRRTRSRFIFEFDDFLETSGMLAQRCLGITGDGLWHVVVTQDDIIRHNGREVQSLVDKKMRKEIFGNIDDTNFINTFVFTVPQFKEVWICYPTNGETNANRGLIWNYGEVNAPLSEVEIDFTYATTGTVEVAAGGTWDADTEVWDADTTPWSLSTRREAVLADSANTKFYQLDSGNDRDGTGFTATLAREGLAVVGVDRDKNPVVDFNVVKQVNRIWPKMEGGPVNVRLGSQDKPDGMVSWSSPEAFDPSTDTWVDIVATGQAVAIEISSIDSVPWKLQGYLINVEVLGAL